MRALHTLELQGLASAAPLAGLGDLLPGLRSVVLAACDLGSDDVLALMRSPGLDSVLVLRCPRVSRSALRTGGCVAGAEALRRPRSVWRT
ncbi:hypothetical protein H632_c6p0 [Helicosporidium sp. ATCC 50920]|nr:hypothetical protein H632_c6p0 [Helicosporidium sp. ATCC 50920]|eukprot:KDD77156.1 hypothetical protein H632_c6p0 [Helicosporidium sp. ATCC 50920]